MDRERRERIEGLFDELADKPVAEQQSLLEAACGEDRDLREAVLLLLAADAASPALLDESLKSLAAELLDAPVTPFTVPKRVGKYVLREFLGEGGMGVVYSAEREGLADRVAIKFLRHTWMSPAARQRFAEEQRTLSSLNHKYIARLYDAGVFEDAPWFVMESVSGVRITEHCQREGYGLRKRLKLFRDACEAVSYAHRQLTVHLDLKPSNMLVNSEGEVKLLDFGIARRLDPADLHRNLTQTHFGLLSLNYAAPEQIRGEAVGIETDVYALGVVLYELLTDRLPADLTQVSAAELARLLEEEPDPPSVAFRRSAASASKPAALSASPPEWRDLDVLCLKAMHKQSERRYRTVDALIRDIDYFLDEQPLDARPDNTWYRVSKFCSRNRRAVAAAALMAATLVAVVVFFTVRLVDARDQALLSQARTERTHRLMLNLFEGEDEAVGPAENLRVVTLLDRGVLGAASLTAEPVVQAELHSTFGDLYQKLGQLERAEPLLRSALDMQRARLGVANPDTLRSQMGLAVLFLDQGKMEESEQLARQALDAIERMRDASPLLVAKATGVMGKILSNRGEYEGAVPLLEKAVRLASPEPASDELTEALTDLANAQYYRGNLEASERLNQQSLARSRQLFGERHPHVAIDYFNLGNIALDRGSYREAEQLFRTSLSITQAWYGKEHPKSASSLLMVGRAVRYQRRLDEAANLYDEALAITKKVYGDGHLRVGLVLDHQGNLALERLRLNEAEELFLRAAEILKRAYGDQHTYYAQELSNLGAVYVKKGQYKRGKQSIEAALTRFLSNIPKHRYTGMARERLASALVGEKRYREAETEALAAYQILKGHGSSYTVEVQDARKTLADVYRALHEDGKLSQLLADGTPH